MTLCARLETARLRLRPVDRGDQAAVLAGLNDLAVSGWLAVVPYPYGAADFDEFLSGFARPGETFVIEDKAGFAGVLGAGRSLGYWLMPRAQGQGYATEAAQAVLAAQFARDRRAVRAGYFLGNAASARVLAKLGFVETGRGEKHCRALGQDRPHVDLRLTSSRFRAACPPHQRRA